VITSNITPAECYPAVFALQRGAFLRRLTHTQELQDQETPVDWHIPPPPPSPEIIVNDSRGGSPILQDTQMVPQTPESQWPIAPTQPPFDYDDPNDGRISDGEQILIE